MKSIKTAGFFALFILISQSIEAQKPLQVRHSCNYYGEETEKDYYQFEPNNEARQIVNELLASSGLSSSSFQLKESNCANALATTVDGVRFILYNPDFLRKFKQDAATKWAAYGALAHEIGHHLNGHNLSETNPSLRRQYELEADKFAGNLLFHLHATVDEAQAGIKTISLEGQSSTHPAKSARLVATTNGWTAALDLSRKNGEIHVKTPDKTVPMPTFTEVSDRLMERKLVGSWQELPVESSTSTLFFSEKGNGFVSNPKIKINRFTWSIKAGRLVLNNEDVEKDKYALVFINSNTIEVQLNGEFTQFKRAN